MNEERTELSNLGEFGLIDRIKQKFTIQNATSLKGIGDDAALLSAGEEVLLVSTDMLLEGVCISIWGTCRCSTWATRPWP